MQEVSISSTIMQLMKSLVFCRMLMQPSNQSSYLMVKIIMPSIIKFTMIFYLYKKESI